MKKLIKKIVAAYIENNKEVICGGLLMTGTSNAFQTYDAIRK